MKNEWSRYLSLIKNGAKKVLIPAYRDMDPYDLPDEFSHLQAQDMSKLGFMQDLIRGIKKITAAEQPKPAVQEASVVSAPAAAGNASIAPLLKRAFMFLEDGDWNAANEYCEKVLDLDPECAEAYLGKLMAELEVRTKDNLKDAAKPFDKNNNFIKAYRFGDGDLKKKLADDIEHIKDRNEKARLEGIYKEASGLMRYTSDEDKLKKAARTFGSILTYKDAAELKVKCEEKAESAKKARIAREEKEREAREKANRERRAAEAAAEKKKKLTIGISSAIAVVLIVIWAIFQTQANNERAVRIFHNFVGEEFTHREYYDNNYSSRVNMGYKYEYITTYTFRSNSVTKKYTSDWQYNEVWEKTTFDDDSHNSYTDRYDYTVSVGLFGKVTVTIGSTVFDVELDRNDDPVSLKLGDDVYR